MRLCRLSHAVIEIAKFKGAPWRPWSPFNRSFTSTHFRKYPLLFDKITSDLPSYEPRARPNPKAKNIAVIGGGVTGLAATYHLSRTLPDASITLFEAKKKLGGWLESELIPVDDGEVLFEWGPRTLRTDSLGPGRYTAQLMAQLNMAEDVLPTSARSPAAVNRYIYYPDHLVRLPGPQPGVNPFVNVVRGLRSIFQEPVFKGILSGLANDLDVDVRPSSLRDESVGNFVTRRFGQPIADNLVSALLHGIYAGDLYKLSVRMIFPLLWHLETASQGKVASEILQQMWNGESLLPYDDVEFALQSDQTLELPEGSMKALANRLEGSSVYTFKNGLMQLAKRTEDALRRTKNVKIKTMTAALTFDSKLRKFQINDADRRNSAHREKPEQYDYVVATISPSHLGQVLKRSDTDKTTSATSPYNDMLKRLRKSTSTVNVMVVNLYYRNPNLLSVTGFGYLIPRSIPVEQNPERALGVIFGSETSRGTPDTQSGWEAMNTGQDSVPGTKLTVMMGGHWWNSWSVSDLPDEASAIEMAKAVLARHLGIVEAPAVAQARMQWNAIPQYRVGHHDRMSDIHRDLSREFYGRLKVAGSAYQGVGVNDCIKSARKVSFDIREGLDERTGLESFEKEAKWAVFRKKDRTVYLTKGGKGGSSLRDV